jgi:hypothetical protein
LGFGPPPEPPVSMRITVLALAAYSMKLPLSSRPVRASGFMPPTPQYGCEQLGQTYTPSDAGRWAQYTAPGRPVALAHMRVLPVEKSNASAAAPGHSSTGRPTLEKPASVTLPVAVTLAR